MENHELMEMGGQVCGKNSIPRRGLFRIPEFQEIFT